MSPADTRRAMLRAQLEADWDQVEAQAVAATRAAVTTLLAVLAA